MTKHLTKKIILFVLIICTFSQAKPLSLIKSKLNITRENYELDSKTEKSEMETTSENYEVDMNWSWSESSGFDITAEYNSEFDNITEDDDFDITTENNEFDVITENSEFVVTTEDSVIGIANTSEFEISTENIDLDITSDESDSEIKTESSDFEITTESRILNKTVELRISLGFETNSRSGIAGLG